jgi:hypothetical protein
VVDTVFHSDFGRNSQTFPCDERVSKVRNV